MGGFSDLESPLGVTIRWDSRMLLAPDPEMELPEVPDKPTPDPLAGARDLLLERTTDFPFAADAERAHALAHTLTQLLSSLVPALPRGGGRGDCRLG